MVRLRVIGRRWRQIYWCASCRFLSKGHLCSAEKKSDSEDTGPFFTEGHAKGFLQAGPTPLEVADEGARPLWHGSGVCYWLVQASHSGCAMPPKRRLYWGSPQLCHETMSENVHCQLICILWQSQGKRIWNVKPLWTFILEQKAGINHETSPQEAKVGIWCSVYPAFFLLQQPELMMKN